MKSISLIGFLIFPLFLLSQTNLSSIEFNNSGDYINFGDWNFVENGNEFTFSFWLNSDTSGTGVASEVIPIMSKWFTSSQPDKCSWGLYLVDDKLQLDVSDGTNVDHIYFDRGFVFNEWHYITVVFNQGMVKYYVDAVLKDVYVSTVTVINNSDVSFKIGDWYYFFNNDYQTFDGHLDEISIWNEELDSNKIGSIMNCRPDSNSLGLVGFWLLDENGGTDIYDYSQNNSLGVYLGGGGWSLDVPLFSCLNSIDENLDNDKYKVFPNPSSGVVTIQSNNFLSEGRVVLMNSMGEMVFVGQMDNGFFQFDVQLYDSGLYQVLVFDGATKLIGSNKLIID